MNHIGTDILHVTLLEGEFQILRFAPNSTQIQSLVAELEESALWFLTKTSDEISLVCGQPSSLTSVCPPQKTEPDWRCFKVEGPLEFSATGIIAGLTTALAKQRISVFAVSTFDTDYFLVPKVRVDEAIEALRESKHIVCCNEADHN